MQLVEQLDLKTKLLVCLSLCLSEMVHLDLKINFSSGAALIESGNHPFTEQTAIKAAEAKIAQISFRFRFLHFFFFISYFVFFFIFPQQLNRRALT